jgi:hypothetical protein
MLPAHSGDDPGEGPFGLPPSNRTGAIPPSPTKCLSHRGTRTGDHDDQVDYYYDTTTAKTDRGPFRSRRQASRQLQGLRHEDLTQLSASFGTVNARSVPVRGAGNETQVLSVHARGAASALWDGRSSLDAAPTKPWLAPRGTGQRLSATVHLTIAPRLGGTQHHTRAALRSRRGRLGWRNPLWCHWGTGQACCASNCRCCATTGGIRRRVPTKRRNKRTRSSPPYRVGKNASASEGFYVFADEG